MAILLISMHPQNSTPFPEVTRLECRLSPHGASYRSSCLTPLCIPTVRHTPGTQSTLNRYKTAPKLVFNHEATLLPLKHRLEKLPSPPVSLGGDGIHFAPWKSRSQGLDTFGKTHCPRAHSLGSQPASASQWQVSQSLGGD